MAIPTNAAVGDSKGNGRIENAVQRFQNQFRRIFENLRAKSNYIVTVDHPRLIGW